METIKSTQFCAHEIVSKLNLTPIEDGGLVFPVDSSERLVELETSEGSSRRFMVNCARQGCSTRRTLFEHEGKLIGESNSPETVADICLATS
jgi:hypothetical protein